MWIDILLISTPSIIITIVLLWKYIKRYINNHKQVKKKVETVKELVIEDEIGVKYSEDNYLKNSIDFCELKENIEKTDIIKKDTPIKSDELKEVSQQTYVIENESNNFYAQDDMLENDVICDDYFDFYDQDQELEELVILEKDKNKIKQSPKKIGDELKELSPEIKLMLVSDALHKKY